MLAKPAREISRAVNLSADEFLNLLPEAPRTRVLQIRHQKLEGVRPKPSTSLVDHSALLTAARRRDLLDRVAILVDENLCGRSEMCAQFAELLRNALVHLHLPARAVRGTAIYHAKGNEIFRWRHGWVRVGAEVIDGNVDCLFESSRTPRTSSTISVSRTAESWKTPST
jgi:hypothetical protein